MADESEQRKAIADRNRIADRIERDEEIQYRHDTGAMSGHSGSLGECAFEVCRDLNERQGEHADQGREVN
jgi:hypothetical protein